MVKNIQHVFFILQFAFCTLQFSILLPTALPAQSLSSYVFPGAVFTNATTDTFICVPKQVLSTLMDREEIYNQMIDALDARIMLCDSALQIKSAEADW